MAVFYIVAEQSNATASQGHADYHLRPAALPLAAGGATCYVVPLRGGGGIEPAPNTPGIEANAATSPRGSKRQGSARPRAKLEEELGELRGDNCYTDAPLVNAPTAFHFLSSLLLCFA